MGICTNKRRWLSHWRTEAAPVNWSVPPERTRGYYWKVHFSTAFSGKTQNILHRKLIHKGNVKQYYKKNQRRRRDNDYPNAAGGKQ